MSWTEIMQSGNSYDRECRHQSEALILLSASLLRQYLEVMGGGGGRVHQCLKDALHRLKRLFKASRVKTVM